MQFLLATEGGVPAEHIASQLSVPIGIVIFCGVVFMLLWANYGAKKGALIYSVAWGGFCAMIGVFWWFGAPGTPVATGLENFPGQPADQYKAKWFPFEGGSERASFYGVTQEPASFVSAAEKIGGPGATPESLEGNEKFATLRGDLDAAATLMELQLFPTDEGGGLAIGSERRQRWTQALPTDLGPNEVRADPFFSVERVDVEVAEDSGTRIAMGTFNIIAKYRDAETFATTREVVVEEGTMWFAFKDPGAAWYPSAVWTIVFLIQFLISLYFLDRLEQREKEQEADQVAEPENLAVPVAQ